MAIADKDREKFIKLMAHMKTRDMVKGAFVKAMHNIEELISQNFFKALSHLTDVDVDCISLVEMLRREQNFSLFFNLDYQNLIADDGIDDGVDDELEYYNEFVESQMIYSPITEESNGRIILIEVSVPIDKIYNSMEDIIEILVQPFMNSSPDDIPHSRGLEFSKEQIEFLLFNAQTMARVRQ